MEYCARLLTSSVGLAIMSGIIIFWAFFAYLKFKSRLIPFYKELKDICFFINSIGDEIDFASRMEELSEKVGATKLLGHRWKEFCETLIYPDIDDKEQIIYNTKSANLYFSREGILGQHIDFRFYNALPNLLTGSGILGTFIGLVAGIYLANKGLTNPATAHAALKDLLGGAALAFLTSIFGLTSSILFSWREKHLIHKFDRLRKVFVDGLDSRLRCVTLESTVKNVLSENKKQTRVLSDFTDQLAFQLTEALEKRMPKALDEIIGAPLTQAMDKLQKSMDTLAENQVKTNEDILREIVEKFSHSISAAAGEEMREFAGAVKLMSEKLQGQIEAVTAQQDEIRVQSQESVQKLAEVFQEGATMLQQRVAESVDEILEGLSTTVTEMTSLLDSTAKRMAEEFDKTASRFTETAVTLSDSVDEIRNVLDSVNSLMESLDHIVIGTQKSLEDLERTVKSMENSTDSMKVISEKSTESVELIRESASGLIVGLERLEEIQGSIEETWASYQQRFESVDESMGRVFGEIDDGTQRYARTVREFVLELDKHTSEITGKLAGAVSELREIVEEIGDAFIKSNS